MIAIDQGLPKERRRNALNLEKQQITLGCFGYAWRQIIGSLRPTGPLSSSQHEVARGERLPCSQRIIASRTVSARIQANGAISEL